MNSKLLHRLILTICLGTAANPALADLTDKCVDANLTLAAFDALSGTESSVSAILGCIPTSRRDYTDGIGLPMADATWASPNKRIVATFKRGQLREKARFGTPDDPLADFPDLLAEYDGGTFRLKVPSLKIVGMSERVRNAVVELPPGQPWRLVAFVDSTGQQIILPTIPNTKLAEANIVDFTGLLPGSVFRLNNGSVWRSVDCNLDAPKAVTVSGEVCSTNPFTGEKLCTPTTTPAGFVAVPPNPAIQIYQAGNAPLMSVEGTPKACQVLRIL